MRKSKKLTRLEFAREWIKACENAILDGVLTVEEYISMLKIKIEENK